MADHALFTQTVLPIESITDTMVSNCPVLKTLKETNVFTKYDTFGSSHECIFFACEPYATTQVLKHLQFPTYKIPFDCRHVCQYFGLNEDTSVDFTNGYAYKYTVAHALNQLEIAFRDPNSWRDIKTHDKIFEATIAFQAIQGLFEDDRFTQFFETDFYIDCLSKLLIQCQSMDNFKFDFKINAIYFSANLDPANPKTTFLEGRSEFANDCLRLIGRLDIYKLHQACGATGDGPKCPWYNYVHGIITLFRTHPSWHTIKYMNFGCELTSRF